MPLLTMTVKGCRLQKRRQCHLVFPKLRSAGGLLGIPVGDLVRGNLFHFISCTKPAACCKMKDSLLFAAAGGNGGIGSDAPRLWRCGKGSPGPGDKAFHASPDFSQFYLSLSTKTFRLQKLERASFSSPQFFSINIL